MQEQADKTDVALTPSSGPVSESVLGQPRSRVDDWLLARADFVALAVLAVALAVRVAIAGATWLNPDEALHFLISNQKTLAGAYRTSLDNAHPPLFFVMLFLWRLLGSSEFTLRLISALAGTAMLWFAYKWMKLGFGKTAGLVGLVVLSFLPPLVSLSAEVRGYAVLLLFMAGALYFQERAFREQKLKTLGLFALFLYMAVLVHYSTVWFAASLGVYGFVLLVGRGARWRSCQSHDSVPARVDTRVGVPDLSLDRGAAPPRSSFTRSWILVQLGVAGLYALLYFSHISKLKGGSLATEAMGGWLSMSYYRPGQESILVFPLKATIAVFRYLFASSVAGIVGLGLFALGIVLVALRFQRSAPRLAPDAVSSADDREMRLGRVLLLVLPFAVSCAGALVRLFPYGGTRHTVFLVLFAVAGVSVALERLLRWRATRGRAVCGLAVAGAAAVLLAVFGVSPEQHISPKNQRRELMERTVRYIRNAVPLSEILFVDYQTSALLGYYLRSREVSPPGEWKGFIEFRYGGYRVVSSPTWSLTNETFAAELDRLANEYGLPPERWIWYADAGWGVPVRYGDSLFGDNICVFPVRVGSWPTPANIGRRLAVMADELADTAYVSSLKLGRVKTVFCPTANLTDLFRARAGRLAGQVISYAELYQALGERLQLLVDYLPALGFWLFNPGERHTEVLAYMNDGENYVSGGYRFTLILTDPIRPTSPHSFAAVYLIEPLVAPGGVAPRNR